MRASTGTTAESRRHASAPAAWRGGRAKPPQGNRVIRSRRHARKDVSKSGSKDVELLARADRYANRRRRAESCERPHDHALPQQLLEHRRAVTYVDVDEIPERRPDGIEPVLAQDRLEPRTSLCVQRTSARELVLVADAGERGGLRIRRDVERRAHLVRRGDD